MVRKKLTSKKKLTRLQLVKENRELNNEIKTLLTEANLFDVADDSYSENNISFIDFKKFLKTELKNIQIGESITIDKYVEDNHFYVVIEKRDSGYEITDYKVNDKQLLDTSRDGKTIISTNSYKSLNGLIKELIKYEKTKNSFLDKKSQNKFNKKNKAVSFDEYLEIMQNQKGEQAFVIDVDSNSKEYGQLHFYESDIDALESIGFLTNVARQTENGEVDYELVTKYLEEDGLSIEDMLDDINYELDEIGYDEINPIEYDYKESKKFY